MTTYLSRIPKLAFLLPLCAKVMFKLSGLVKNANSMVESVGNNNLLVDAETETVRRRKLTFSLSKMAEFVKNLHRMWFGHTRRCQRWIQCHRIG